MRVEQKQYRRIHLNEHVEGQAGSISQLVSQAAILTKRDLLEMTPLYMMDIRAYDDQLSTLVLDSTGCCWITHHASNDVAETYFRSQGFSNHHWQTYLQTLSGNKKGSFPYVKGNVIFIKITHPEHPTEHWLNLTFCHEVGVHISGPILCRFNLQSESDFHFRMLVNENQLAFLDQVAMAHHLSKVWHHYVSLSLDQLQLSSQPIYCGLPFRPYCPYLDFYVVPDMSFFNVEELRDFVEMAPVLEFLDDIHSDHHRKINLYLRTLELGV